MAFFVERPIPERPYFKVGEAAHILGVAPSTVRYWQKEFPGHIRAELSRSGQNVFSRGDVIVMAVILNLVRTDGMSIRDARTRLTEVIAEHGGRVDRIQLCQQFELPLADGGPAQSGIEPIEQGIRRDPAPFPDRTQPDQDECTSDDVSSGSHDEPPPAAAPAPLVDTAAVDALRADLGEEIARMQAELDAQLSMNEFLAEDNRLLRATVVELRAENSAMIESIRDTLHAILDEIDG